MTQTERMFIFGSLGILIGHYLDRTFRSLPWIFIPILGACVIYMVHPAQDTMTRGAVISIALIALIGPDLVLGAPADNGVICRQKRLHVPGLICPGDSEAETVRPETPRLCRPWNMDFLRKLYVFGNAEQRAWVEKAIDDIWAGRNGWCPVR